MTRRIRLFLSSPGDVALERDQCEKAVEELNATMRALIPGKDVELDLFRWETDTYPNLTGTPQDVVDAQSGGEFDIYLGIMWSRFGTPTSTAGSGTEQEFRAAKRGWEETRKPSHLLFYFCNADIPAFEAGQNADQLKAVAAFRKELSEQGLVRLYAERSRFGDQVRRDLVLVLSGLLVDATPAQVAGETASRVSHADLATVRQQVEAESTEYESLRERMQSGDERTRRMEVVASRLRTLAQSVYPLLPELVAHDRSGHRLAAICTLQALPTAHHLEWLGQRVCVEVPFMGYHAALALLSAARALPVEDMFEVSSAIEHAEACTRRLRSDTDRAKTLEYCRREVAVRQRQRT